MYELEPIIKDFEYLSKCRITLHDHHHLLINNDGSLMVERIRFSHRKTHNDCQYAPRNYCVEHCMFCYNNKIMRRSSRCYVNHCKYGNIEVAVPVFNGDAHVFSIFAGIWKTPLSACDREMIRMLERLLPVFASGLLDEAEKIRRSSKMHNTLEDKIRNFAVENFNRSVSTHDLAEKLSLSVSRVCHLVRECCGCSFTELLITERMKHAKLFLLHTDYRISEIAFMCGFQCVENFNRTFKTRTNSTPLEYRKM